MCAARLPRTFFRCRHSAPVRLNKARTDVREIVFFVILAHPFFVFAGDWLVAVRMIAHSPRFAKSNAAL